MVCMTELPDTALSTHTMTHKQMSYAASVSLVERCRESNEGKHASFAARMIVGILSTAPTKQVPSNLNTTVLSWLKGLPVHSVSLA